MLRVMSEFRRTPQWRRGFKHMSMFLYSTLVSVSACCL